MKPPRRFLPLVRASLLKMPGAGTFSLDSVRVCWLTQQPVPVTRACSQFCNCCREIHVGHSSGVCCSL
jgi:hypothetical protein